MARLTVRQLRAIFAKMARAKAEIARGRAPTVSIRSGIVHTDMDRIFSPAIANHYIQRLPQKHRGLSTLPDATRVKVWNNWIEDDEFLRNWAGAYYTDRREIHVTRSLDIALRRRGYFVSSRFLPRATRVTPPPSGPMSLKEISRRRTVQARNAKVGIAHTFYHEYAHSILHGYLFKLDELYPPGWKRLARTKEWRQFVGAKGKMTSAERTSEAFAEAYAHYATTKKTREQLRRESPRSYEYMKKFFETGELD